MTTATLVAAEESDVHERVISVPKCAKPIAKVVVSEIKCKSPDKK